MGMLALVKVKQASDVPRHWGGYGAIVAWGYSADKGETSNPVACGRRCRTPCLAGRKSGLVEGSQHGQLVHQEPGSEVIGAHVLAPVQPHSPGNCRMLEEV